MTEDEKKDMILLRQELLEEAEKDDLVDLENFTTGSFGMHEALHEAYLWQSAVAGLLEHRAIIQDEELFKLTYKAHGLLFDLYQKLGEKHLSEDVG